MNTWFLNRQLRIVVAAVVIIGVVAGGIVFLRRSSGTQPGTAQTSAPVPVQVVQVKTGSIRTVLTYSGAIQSSQQVSLAPRLAGQLASITVDVGTAVKVGDVLATLDTGTLPAQLQQAQASLQSAQARLDLMLAGPRAEDISAAQAQLDSAQATYNQLFTPATADLVAAQTAVITAQAALQNAESARSSTRATVLGQVYQACNSWGVFGLPCNSIVIPLPPDVVEAMQSTLQTGIGSINAATGVITSAALVANAAYITAIGNVTVLQQALLAAKAKLDALQNPSAAAVAAQRSLLEAARANLANKKLPYTDADIAGARATVAAAQATAVAARTSLEQTSVTAPFDGVVAQKLLDVGATVSVQTPVFVLVAKAVEIHLMVDEARIGLIKPDMETEVTVPAFPNRIFKGKVATIAPLGDARAHTFDVKVFAEDREGLLKPGMFAQVNVIAATKQNAILVPTAAIVQQGPTARVFVIANGKASAKTVKLGIADTTNTEITEGVTAGDQVVTVGQNVLRDGQAAQIATPGAGGAPRPSGTAGASSTPGGASATAGPSGSPAGSGTPARSGTPAGSPGASGSPQARPSGTGTP